jgi:AcrR family transcriptional regulator
MGHSRNDRAILSRVAAEDSEHRRRSDGERTHAAILETATRLASIEGVHGLTIGRVAEETGISKSGLYAHFGSKEQLQLEVIQAAGEIVMREVVEPAMEAPEGLRRLEALTDAYFSYVERWVFPGGCFFSSLLAEADARSGPIHDSVVEGQRQAGAEMTELVRAAQRSGELDRRTDAAQLAFEIDACMSQANYLFVLFRDPKALRRGREGIRRILDAARVRKSRARSSA